MKSIEQIAIETANTITAPYISDEILTRFAANVIEAWLAQQTPVAWLVGSVIDSFAVKGYETCSEADAKLCDGFPVFLAPQQPVHSEPFAWLAPNGMTLSTYPVLNSQALYLAPPTAKQEPTSYQFQDRNGQWKDFLDQRHYENTLADGSWPIRALYTAPPTAIPEGWQPISTAPTDGTEIIGFCNHDADEYSLNEGKTLTNYACACEAYGHVEDGQHVVYWERETTDGSWEEGYYTLPGYWAAKGSDGECCANPTHWQPLPPPPGEKKCITE